MFGLHHERRFGAVRFTGNFSMAAVNWIWVVSTNLLMQVRALSPQPGEIDEPLDGGSEDIRVAARLAGGCQRGG